MENTDNILDVLFSILAVAALTKILPPIAALLSIVWTASRFYDNYKAKQAKSKMCAKCGDELKE